MFSVLFDKHRTKPFVRDNDKENRGRQATQKEPQITDRPKTQGKKWIIQNLAYFFI